MAELGEDPSATADSVWSPLEDWSEIDDYLGMQIGVGEFKARCLAIVEDLHQHGGQVYLTKRGRPIALLVPVPPEETVDLQLEGVAMRPDWR